MFSEAYISSYTSYAVNSSGITFSSRSLFYIEVIPKTWGGPKLL